MSVEQKRYLTPEEVEDIVSQIPEPPSLSSEIRRYTADEIRNSLYLQLLSVTIYPSMIPKLKAYIINHGTKSFLNPGMHVGMNTGESTGQPATQLNLDAFHQSGQANKKSGFQRFQQKISLKKDPSASSTIIHFIDTNISYEDAFMAGKKFVSLKLGDILVKPVGGEMFEILVTDSADRSWYTDFEIANTDYYNERMDEYNGYFARMTFDKQKLFLHKITLQEIVTHLNSVEVSKGKDTSDFVTFFCGPLTEGVIDVYPNVDFIENTFKFSGGGLSADEKLDSNVRRFFQETFQSFITSAVIGNYQYVTDTTVKMTPTHDLIQGVQPDYATESGEESGKLRIWINPVVEKTSGIPIEKLILLLQALGMTVDTTFLTMEPTTFHLGYLLVNKTDNNGKTLPIDTEGMLKLIKDEIKNAEDRMIEQFEDQIDPNLPDLITDPIFRYGNYCTVVTTGTNLREIRAHPDVCAYRTFSDSPMEIYEVIGIEAMRNYLEKEIYDLFKNADQIIAPRNITAMIDWICVGPKPSSINSKSISKQNRGIFPQACFEDPVRAVSTGAPFGPTEKITNTSSSILFGTRVNTGTGAFDLEVNESIVQQFRNFQSSSDVGANRLTGNVLAQLVGNDRRKQVQSRVGREPENRDAKSVGRGSASKELSRLSSSRSPARAAGFDAPLPRDPGVDALLGMFDLDSDSDDSFNPDDVPDSIADDDNDIEFGEI